MSQKIITAIENVTLEAYQCIESFGLAPTTLQDYWFFYNMATKKIPMQKCRNALTVMQMLMNLAASMSADIETSEKWRGSLLLWRQAEKRPGNTASDK